MASQHSSSWALKTALHLDGKAEGVSEPLLFGLGASAFYSWSDDSRVLKGLHPDRIVRALLALNITTISYRHMDEGVFGPLDAQRRGERPVIANLRLSALARPHPTRLEDDGDFSVVILPFEGEPSEREALEVRYLSHLEDGVVTRPAAEFADRWFAEEEGRQFAAWFVHLSTKDAPLRWEPAFSVERAVWQYVEQMRGNRLGAETTGLAALDALIGAMEAGRVVSLRRTWERAKLDGGAQLWRDVMAAFLAEAAALLAVPRLHDAALELREAGYLWARIFAMVDAGWEETDLVLPLLRQIRASEQRTLGHLARALDRSWH